MMSEAGAAGMAEIVVMVAGLVWPCAMLAHAWGAL